MQRLFNIILSIGATAYIAFAGVMALNGVYNFWTMTGEFLPFVYKYGWLILLGAFSFVNLFGKGFLRIIFFIIFVVVAVATCLAFFKPEIFSAIMPK